MTEQQPWWHDAPDQPPVDSVVEEGLKLFAALKDWAVESGAVAAVADLTASAANSAGEYLAHVQETPAEAPDSDQPVGRCRDCPVCAGLDALEATNPQWAQTARGALAQVSAVVAGLIQK